MYIYNSYIGPLNTFITDRHTHPNIESARVERSKRRRERQTYREREREIKRERSFDCICVEGNFSMTRHHYSIFYRY